MISQAKRQNAAMMALLVFFLSVFPARPAHALVPLAVGLTLRVLAQGAAMGTADLLTSGITGLIGGSIMALALSPSEISDGSQVSPIRVPTTTADSSAYIPSPPNVDQDSTYVGSAPAAGTEDSTFSGWSVGAGNYYPTMAAAASGGLYQTFPPLATIQAAAPVGVLTAYDCWVEDDYFDGTCNTFVKNAYGEYTNGTRMYPQYDGDPRCPAGYSVSESSSSGCALTDPAAASKDWLADFRRNGQEYTFSDADALPAYANNNGGKVGVYGTDSQGRPVYVQVTPTPYGGSQIGIYTQVGDSVVGQTLTIGANGTVTGASSTVDTGSIFAPTTVNTPAVVTTDTGTGTGTGTTTDPLVFPTDYARTGEASAAGNMVKTSIDQLKDKFSNTETVDDPTVPDWADNWGGTFNPLKAWSMPNHSSACPVSGFDFNGSYYTFDSHCQLMIDHWSGLQTAAVVVWTIAALFILLGA